MKARVTIVDYGVGNLFSVRGALEYCGAEPELSSSPEAVENAERLLLPGVGAFADSMADMRDCGLVEPVRAFAANGGPVLGICLGMPMLFAQREECVGHGRRGRGPCMGPALPPTGAAASPPPTVPPARAGWPGRASPPAADGLARGRASPVHPYFSTPCGAAPAVCPVAGGT